MREINELVERITSYLTCGGMFNPEMAIHDAVSELLFDCREALTKPTDAMLIPNLQAKAYENGYNAGLAKAEEICRMMGQHEFQWAADAILKERDGE